MKSQERRKILSGRNWLRAAARRLQRCLRAVLLGALLPGTAMAQAPEAVQLWTYHNFPPFVTDLAAQKGLTFDLADQLTQLSDGRFVFEVTVLPRFRLNEYLGNGEPGVVPWVNPVWFADQGQTRYLWTRKVMQDRNSVISPSGSPVEYSGPESLDGMILAAVRGHRYAGVQELIEQGRISRVDVRSEKSLVQFIAAERGGAAILATSALEFYLQDAELRKKVFVSRQPHSAYQRHILTQKDLPHVHAFIDAAMTELIRSGSWQTALEEYSAPGKPQLQD